MQIPLTHLLTKEVFLFGARRFSLLLQFRRQTTPQEILKGFKRE